MSHLENKALLRLPKVLSLMGVSRSHWWDGVKKGMFPAPIKLSPRVTVWRASDIAALLDCLSAKAEG